MGNEQLNLAVADAGPLIHLAEIGCLSLLSIFDHLHIPEAVWFETVGLGRVFEHELMEKAHVQRHSLDRLTLNQFIEDNGLSFLQDGEKEGLFLCQQVNASIILTDDLAVRKVSKSLQLIPVGSLGIIVKAYRQKLISYEDAEHYIEALYDVSSLYVTRAIVELAVEQISNIKS